MKKNYQILMFLVTAWKSSPFTQWATEDLCKFPVHGHYYEKRVVDVYRYLYDPASNFEKDDLIKFLIQKIKRDFNADEVEQI
ncbi:hypothetical protein [Psychroserpens sp. Hel_I_66]|uniref:hypothetical protein n=1 Tax=Psychroserpens sp. Hel_I_66 TaxID=1250004 RepID=UPI000645E250|nr:hypothetical protein [Psychroserpens sp. Hel_I_66]